MPMLRNSNRSLYFGSWFILRPLNNRGPLSLFKRLEIFHQLLWISVYLIQSKLHRDDGTLCSLIFMVIVISYMPSTMSKHIRVHLKLDLHLELLNLISITTTQSCKPLAWTLPIGHFDLSSVLETLKQVFL